MLERAAGRLPDSAGRIFAIAFAVALILRLAFLLVTGPISAPDTAEYRLLAHNLRTSGQYALQTNGAWQPYAFRMPLYQCLLAQVFAVFGEGRTGDWAIVIVQVVLSAVTAGLVSIVGALTIGRTTGILAAFFFAVDPLPIAYSAYILTDTLFALLVTSALVVAIYALRSQAQKDFLMWGLLIGAATLTRPLFKYYAIVPIMTLILSRRPLRTVVRNSLAFLVGMALLIGPWIIRNKVQLDFWGLELNQGQNTVWSTFRLTEESSPAEREADPKLAAARDVVARASEPSPILSDVMSELRVSQVVADRYLERIGWENIWRHPLGVAEIAAWNAFQIMISRVGTHELFQRVGLIDEFSLGTKGGVVVTFLVFLLSVVVTVGVAWVCCRLAKHRENWPWLGCFVLTSLYVVGLTSMVAGSNRYRLPIEGILSILFAASVVEVMRKLPITIQSRLRAWSLGLLSV
jgi:4-amino-4-deoxy-L-arabinose transferase-like glycosyltransferase